MPMSPRLLRPLASRSLVDADAAAYLTAVQNADNQALEPAVRNAITAFVIGCKQDGIWSAIKASCILMGARTLSGALTPLVGTAPTNNGPFVSGDYNRETGLVGNGSTKYLNSNRSNNADPQNSKHHSVFVSVQATVGGILNGAQVGGAAGQSGITVVPQVDGNAFRVNNASSPAPTARTLRTNFLGVQRSTSSSYVLRTNGEDITETIASDVPANEDIGILGRTTGANFCNARLAFYSIGESLDLALLDSRVTTLYNAIGTAIP